MNEENLKQIASLFDGSVDKDSNGFYWISTQFGSLRINPVDGKTLAFALLEDAWAEGELTSKDCQRLTNMAIGD